MHFYISFPRVCLNVNHDTERNEPPTEGPNTEPKVNLLPKHSFNTHTSIAIGQMENQVQTKDRLCLAHIVLCCLRNCSLLSLGQVWYK